MLQFKVSNKVSKGHLDQREGEGEAKGKARPLKPVPLHECVQTGRDVVKELVTRPHLYEDMGIWYMLM